MRTMILGAAVIGALMSTTAGAVITTFASYTQVGTGSTLRNTRTGLSSDRFSTISTQGATQPGSVEVKFNFLIPALASAGLTDLNATMFLNSTQVNNPSIKGGGFTIQPGYQGSFSFIYSGATPLVVGGNTYTTGARLLVGTFTEGSIIGATNSSSGNFSASTDSGSVVTFESDFLDFSTVQKNDIALTLTSIVPGLSAGTNLALNTFRASGTGSFSSDPAPLVVGLVPEPASWALMILGFGAVGVHMRQRRRPTAFA